MHHICYNYTDTTKNRLSDISATGLNSGTYQYDALGNLVRDNAEGLTIGWNALGKVDTIRRNDVLISSFRYSPTGQRQVKATGSDTTFYIHDATGNVMCVYRLKNDTLTASERYIYGSKRLGMLGQQVWITAGGAARLQDRNTIGHRLYELTDHLGNVTTTLPDRKCLTPNANNELIYVPDAVTYTDYYPFGFPMPRPGFTMGGYRYFFNGQEADNEVLGEGSLAGYEFRQYDTRLGRWWGVDPQVGRTPSLSAFTAFRDNPILYADPDGRKEFITLQVQTNSGQTIVLRKQVSNRIMTDGVPHRKVSKLSSATWHYENYYYDYEHVYTVTMDQNGEMSCSYSLKINNSGPVRDADNIWFGGNEFGDAKIDWADVLSSGSLNQPDGWNLVSVNGGASPTQYKATEGSPNIIDVDLLIAAMSGFGATGKPLPDMRNNRWDRVILTKLVTDLVQNAVEQSREKNKKKREEYEEETVIVDFTVNEGNGKWHQGSQSNVPRKDSARIAKERSNEK